jgi:SNF2 family DNA or RNA helicase
MTSYVQIRYSNVDFNIDVDELNEEDPRTLTPPYANITLKPHQQTLLHRCIEYENKCIALNTFKNLSHLDTQDYLKTNVAILGDRVGSGKSYVILSLLVSNDITHKDITTIKSHGFSKVMFYVHDKTSSIKTNLLVVPHNLATQWEYYVSNFGANIKYKVIKSQKNLDAFSNVSEDETNNPTSGEDVSNIASTSNNPPQSQQETFASRLAQYDLVIVTSTLYNKFVVLFNELNVKLQRVIYDEVDNLNIPGCKAIDTNFTWFVTASYGNVIYPKGFSRLERSVNKYVWYAYGLRHSGYIKNILMDLYCNLPQSWIKTLVVKNTEAFVEKSLLLPEMNTHYIKCKTPYTINVLNGLVDRNIMNHLNADDIQGALTYVNPSNKTSQDNIIARVIDKYKRQAENINLTIHTTQQMNYDIEDERQAELSRLQRNYDNIIQKINMITERIKNNDMCTICYDATINKTITQCCQNSFCFKCINMWLTQKKTCPMCKVGLDISKLYVVQDGVDYIEETIDEEEEVDMTKPNHKNDKFENLELILNNLNEEAKVLIFSAYENSFENIIPVLLKLRISYDYLKGNGNQINAILNRYKNGNVKVLLINTKNYGSGLNLENTTDMVLFHKFDTEIEKQVIGRAQRFGRKDPLNVHFLMYDNEMPHTNITQ